MYCTFESLSSIASSTDTLGPSKINEMELCCHTLLQLFCVLVITFNHRGLPFAFTSFSAQKEILINLPSLLWRGKPATTVHTYKYRRDTYTYNGAGKSTH